MIFRPTSIPDLTVVEPEPRLDERGLFARTFCEEEFRAHGLHAHFPQCNVSLNILAGTIRGLHFQRGAHAEPKLVRATAGRIFDVAVDLRPGSPTRYQWHAVELSSTNRLALYIPPGFAHGFQTLEPQTEVFYQMGKPFEASAAAGLAFDDPTLAIAWPLPALSVSPKDRALPHLTF